MELISRQAVLDLLQMKYSGKELYKAIYELPPVENKGEWIEEDDSIACRCSECGCGIFRAQNWFKFCPNCGADMREPKGEKGET